MKFLTPYSSILLALLRIISGYLFMMHGSAKLLGIPFVEQMAGVPLFSMYGIAGVLELIGGVLLIIGLLTRPVAFLLAGEMAFAYFISHASGSTFLTPILNGGELAVLYCFVFLYLSAAGSGAWALDNMCSPQSRS